METIVRLVSFVLFRMAAMLYCSVIQTQLSTRLSQGAAILRNILIPFTMRIICNEYHLPPRSPDGVKLKVNKKLNKDGISCHCKVNSL